MPCLTCLVPALSQPFLAQLSCLSLMTVKFKQHVITIFIEDCASEIEINHLGEPFSQ